MSFLDFLLFLSGIVFLVGFLVTFFVFLVFLFSFFVPKNRFSKSFSAPVSVIVPAFNSGKTIAECLESVFSSGHRDLQVIVVDDGSTDDSVRIARGFRRVKIVEMKHGGKVSALNEGLKHARHEFVLTLDSDTFLEEGFFEKSLFFFSDKKVGAVCGLVKVFPKKGLLNLFLRVEYLYNHLLMKSFSEVFSNSVWFFGGVSIYRKSVLEKIGFFRGNTLSEDLLVALEIKKAGFKVLHASNASVLTIVPNDLRGLFSQRRRWWLGSFQAILFSKIEISFSQNPAVIFLFFNQLWWSFYSIVCFPVLFFLIWYWFPFGNTSEILFYLFRWFSLLGPLYYVYKIPEWGLSFVAVFGVASALLSSFLLFVSGIVFRAKIDFGFLFALFFYFPYALLMNLFVVLSVLSVFFYRLRGKSVGWS